MTAIESAKIKRTGLKAAAVIVMSSVVLSRFTGYLREMLIPASFGLSSVSDAYNIAFLLPDLMYSLLVGGAVSAALIPVMAGYLQKDEEMQGWKAVSTFINVSFIAMIALCAIGMILAPQVITVVAAGYSRRIDQSDLPLIVNLTRILFPSVAFLMLAGLCNGILNSYRKFAAAAYGPSIYNILCILSIVFLSNKNPDDHYGVEKVAMGVAVSAFLYFLIQLAFSFKQMHNYKPFLEISNPGFRRLFKLAVPSLASSSVMQVNIIISASFASLFAIGSVTALNIANRTWQMPLGIIAQGMGVAILPSLSSWYAAGDHMQYKGTLGKGLRAVLLLAVPSAAGFLALSEPIIRTAFKFSDKVREADITLTASILAVFSAALLAQSFATILNRGYFARNDTKTPLYISISTIALNIALNFAFYTWTPFGVMGMAVSYSIASMVNAVLLLIFLGRESGSIDLKSLGRYLIRIVPAAAITGLAMYLLNLAVPVGETIKGVDACSKFMQFLLLFGEIAAGSLVYFSLAIAFKVEEAVTLKNMVMNRIMNILISILPKKD